MRDRLGRKGASAPFPGAVLPPRSPPPPPPSQTWGSFILSAENKRGNIGPGIKGKRGLKRRERGPKGKGRGDPKENGTKKKRGHTQKKRIEAPPKKNK